MTDQKMAQILVTGANGQLGSEMRDLASAYKNLQFLFTDVDTLDITDIVKLKSFFNTHKVDYIINAAAYTAVDKAESEKPKAEAVNVNAVRNLVQLANNYKARLVHISTDYVFDGKAQKPYLESDEVSPQGVYGKTKLDGEIEARRYTQAIIIRTSWLYSSHGSNFVKTILKLGRDRGAVSVVNDQKGSPTYAHDLAKVILNIISAAVEDISYFKPGVYNYANDGECTWYDFAKEIFEMSGVVCTVTPIPTRDYPTPAKRPAYSVLDKTKIKNTWQISIPHWKESLQVCLGKIKL
jgi:dTDP-4-dehydrorhamnose reductase